MTFEHTQSYPISTLPDDLYDEAIPNRDRWALKSALFWNDCQGWWEESISQYWRNNRFSSAGHMARYWRPMPPDPMTRAEILAERGDVVCMDCDLAIDPTKPHDCKPSEHLIRQRLLQRAADRTGT